MYIFAYVELINTGGTVIDQQQCLVCKGGVNIIVLEGRKFRLSLSSLCSRDHDLHVRPNKFLGGCERASL